MKISVDTSRHTSIVTLTMTLNQLNVIRFALAEGVEKLQSRASYLKGMAHAGNATAKKTLKESRRIVRESKAASEALEDVTRKWATGWVKDHRGKS